MIDRMTSHPSTPYVMALVLATGVTCILIGALAGRSAEVIGAFCGTGSVLTLSAVAISALWFDRFAKRNRLEENNATPPQAAYIPPDTKTWQQAIDMNPKQNIADFHVVNGDPPAVANLTIDNYCRLNKGLGDKDL